MYSGGKAQLDLSAVALASWNGAQAALENVSLELPSGPLQETQRRIITRQTQQVLVKGDLCRSESARIRPILLKMIC